MTTERQIQAQVFEWAAYAVAEMPELDLMFAIPNGQMRKGMPMEPGLKRGVPDLLIPCPRRETELHEGVYVNYQKFSGLFIELKKPGGRLTKDQNNWIHALEQQGYCARVCYGFDEARQTIEWYLGTDHA